MVGQFVFAETLFYKLFIYIFLFTDIEASRAAGLGFDDEYINELLMDPSYTSMDQKVSTMLSPLVPQPPPASVPPSSLLNGKSPFPSFLEICMKKIFSCFTFFLIFWSVIILSLLQS